MSEDEFHLRTESALAEAEAKPPWRKILFLALLAGMLLAIVYVSPLRDYLGRLKEVSASIRGLGWLAPFVFTVSVAILVAVGFPRLILCVIAGMALGFWSGLIWTQLGTLVGNYALFLIVRFGGGDWARRYVSKRARLHAFIQQEGLMGVILARQLPVPGLLVNLTLGLVALRHRDFLIGTALGQLPEAVPCTLIGAGLLKSSFGHSVWIIGLAAAVAVVFWISLRRLLRTRAVDVARSEIPAQGRRA
jgi:uncharacterized membrane protein YdjX (TVP38/TMEM64 family)